MNQFSVLRIEKVLPKIYMRTTSEITKIGVKSSKIHLPLSIIRGLWLSNDLNQCEQ